MWNDILNWCKQACEAYGDENCLINARRWVDALESPDGDDIVHLMDTMKDDECLYNIFRVSVIYWGIYFVYAAFLDLAGYEMASELWRHKAEIHKSKMVDQLRGFNIEED